MSEDPKFVDHPDANVVLRGGPLDGGRTRAHPGWPPISLRAGDQDCWYRPAGEMDTEYPTLAVYAFDHAEPA